MATELSDDGGPAFPMPTGPEPRHNETTHYNEGMSLRDYFAGQALLKLTASLLGPGESNSTMTREVQLHIISKDCYAIADAMLKARSKQ